MLSCRETWHGFVTVKKFNGDLISAEQLQVEFEYAARHRDLYVRVNTEVHFRFNHAVAA